LGGDAIISRNEKEKRGIGKEKKEGKRGEFVSASLRPFIRKQL